MEHTVIVEIDGVRHKMIKGRKGFGACLIGVCQNCSLEKVCTDIVGTACLSGNYHFRLCKEGE